MTSSKHRNQRVQSLLGLGLIGNLSVTLGLLPWFTLSAQGQAILLETNPAPAIPEVEIPTNLTPAPVYEAPPEPEVAYEPEPIYNEPAPQPLYEAPAPEPVYSEPEPVYEAPQPNYAAESIAPVPQAETGIEEIAPAAPTNIAPVNTEPTFTPPAPVAQSSGTSQIPASGCAALLDLNDIQNACAPAPVVPSNPIAPPQLLAEDTAQPLPLDQPIQPTAAMQPAIRSIPPARQITAQTTPITATPPARQVRAIAPEPAYSSPVIPKPQTRISNYQAPVIPKSPQRPALSASASTSQNNFTVVKPQQYGLKPLTSKSPLEWILGDQAMLFPMPVPMAVSSAFGWREHPIRKSWHLHSGIDFAAPQGTPVLAAYDGQVAIANHIGGYGLTVLLSHQNGQRQTRYAHLSEIYVQPGKKVSQGDVIGAVGSTGNSTGPHLHFETLEKTSEGMVIVDPTEEVKAALIRTLERMQHLAKLRQRQAADANNSEPVNISPIPVEVIEPMSGYQASAQIGRIFLTE